MIDQSQLDRLASNAMTNVEKFLNSAAGLADGYSMNDSDKRRFDSKSKMAELWLEVLRVCISKPEFDGATIEAIEAIRRAHGVTGL